jgi:drug/metabolite transporter (DMT)-like permease
VFLGKLGDLALLAAIGAIGIALRNSGRFPHGIAAWCTLRIPSRPFWAYIAPTALLDTAANVAYNLGLATSLTAVVSVLSALSSAVTVLLAAIFLRERLSRRQRVGIAAILVGIALVSL